MTYAEAMELARRLANQYQVWYEVHTNGTDFMVIEKGDDSDDGYDHHMSISPNRKVPNE